jgi:hypothetical protein
LYRARANLRLNQVRSQLQRSTSNEQFGYIISRVQNLGEQIEFVQNKVQLVVNGTIKLTPLPHESPDDIILRWISKTTQISLIRLKWLTEQFSADADDSVSLTCVTINEDETQTQIGHLIEKRDSHKLVDGTLTIHFSFQPSESHRSS